MNMLSPSSKMPVEIDGALVATALDLDVDRFRELMDGQKIDLLCERGTGDDTGAPAGSLPGCDPHGPIPGPS